MKVLAKFFWDCGRSGDLDGLFIADKEAINLVVGKNVYFGEVLGKHSEVYGKIGPTDIDIISEDQSVIQVLLDAFNGDSSISGFNPFDYISESEQEDE